MNKIVSLRDKNVHLLEHLILNLKKQTEVYAIQAWMHAVFIHAERMSMRIDQIIAQQESKGDL